jgi:hypothetical protein
VLLEASSLRVFTSLVQNTLRNETILLLGKIVLPYLCEKCTQIQIKILMAAKLKTKGFFFTENLLRNCLNTILQVNLLYHHIRP